MYKMYKIESYSIHFVFVNFLNIPCDVWPDDQTSRTACRISGIGRAWHQNDFFGAALTRLILRIARYSLPKCTRKASLLCAVEDEPAWENHLNIFLILFINYYTWLSVVIILLIYLKDCSSIHLWERTDHYN